MIKKIPAETPYYHFYNANPKDRRTGDCLIRALAVALGKSWDDVVDDLVAIAHKTKYTIGEQRNYEQYLKSNDYTIEKQPKHEDNTKLTGEELCRLLDYRHMTKPVLANIGADHIVVFAKIDGRYKIHDIWNCQRYKIGKVYIHHDDIQNYYNIRKVNTW